MLHTHWSQRILEQELQALTVLQDMEAKSLVGLFYILLPGPSFPAMFAGSVLWSVLSLASHLQKPFGHVSLG